MCSKGNLLTGTAVIENAKSFFDEMRTTTVTSGHSLRAVTKNYL